MASPVLAQSGSPAMATRASVGVEAVVEKNTEVRLLAGSAPHIDGVLDDPIWTKVDPITDFIQKDPQEGGQPSDRTEVRLIYDDKALYVGARMYSSNPRAIRRAVTRRDGDSDAEVLVVSLDTYLDRRTAYSFALSSGGVRKDYYHSQDAEDSPEMTFDPVWQGRARIDSLGWTAEMRIPFSQLRFSKKQAQVWGLEIKRAIPGKNENNYWVLIPKAATGYPSHFGYLRGISGIRPSRRLELLPYTAGDVTVRGNPNPANPFDSKLGGRAGGDLKMGLGPNLTLDGTINPDFGQVEADPADVNLTAFETVFDERRPFFIEGNELLRGRGLSFLGRPTYFYSRRIGAQPHGTATGDFIKSPVNTTILAASKVTGRLASGLSLGAMAAVTPREYARVYSTSTGQFSDTAVEPPAGYGVVRLQQEVGKEHSTLGWTVTNVTRSLGGPGNLNQLLVRQANAAGTDWRVRFMQGKYEFTGFAGYSHLAGDAAAIARVQQSSAHYFQRPDQDHVSFDPNRTSMTGYTFSVRGDKNAGRHSVWGIQLNTRTQGFEINDLGQMRRGDAIDYSGDFSFRDTKPHRQMRYWQFGGSFTGSSNYSWVRTPTKFNQTGQLIFPNFWKFSWRNTWQPRALSDEQTRGGPLMGTPSTWSWQVSLANQTQATYSWTGTAAWGFDELNAWNWSLTGGLTLRPAPRWQASITPRYLRSVDSRQYVQTTAGGPAITYGGRYIFSYIERWTLGTQFRLNYAFTPDLTLEAYAEPFAASGNYYGFGELSAPRSRNLRTYGTAGTTIARQADGSYSVTDGPSSFAIANPNFNQLSFRSNLVMRWEWTRGSTLFLIWQQSRSGLTSDGLPIRFGSLWDATTAQGDNFFAVKITYWISAR
jgi:hypothetical protein